MRLCSGVFELDRRRKGDTHDSYMRMETVVPLPVKRVMLETEQKGYSCVLLGVCKAHTGLGTQESLQGYG
jgi:hypothetical protein